MICICTHTRADQLYFPQSPVTNKGVPAGYVSQQGYAGHPLVPVSPQPSQAHNSPLQPLGGRKCLHG